MPKRPEAVANLLLSTVKEYSTYVTRIYIDVYIILKLKLYDYNVWNFTFRIKYVIYVVADVFEEFAILIIKHFKFIYKNWSFGGFSRLHQLQGLRP